MSWPTVTLGELCAPKQWPIISKAKMTNTGYVVYGANGPIGFTGTVTHRCRTILVGCRGSCGSIHIIPPMSYANGNAMALDDLDDQRIDLDYLAFFLRHRGFADIITGSSQPQIIQSNMVRIEVPLPPIVVQRRIVQVLSKAVSLSQKRQKTLKLLGELPNSIFQSMFGVDPAGDHKFPRSKLGDLIKVKSGDFLVAKDMVSDGPHPVYGGNGVNGTHNIYMFDEPKIVLGRVGAYCGAVHITRPRSWITDNALYVSEIKRPMSITFLAAALQQANLNQYAGRSAQPLISGSRIYPVEICTPPLNKQEEFERIVNKTDITRLAAASAAKQLEASVSVLQQRAFTGRL